MDMASTTDRKFQSKPGQRLRPAGHIYQPQAAVSCNYSIPSKYKCIVSRHPEQNGFLSQECRFVTIMAVVPGPGAYNISIPIDHTSASLSAYGTCGFASQTQRRTGEQIKAYPASNSYYLPPLMEPSKNRCSAVYMPASAVSERFTYRKSTEPGPASYNPENNANRCTQASVNQPPFLSSTERRCSEADNDTSKFPGPGHYSIENCKNAMSSSPKAACSAFKSTSMRCGLGTDEIAGNSKDRIWHAAAISLLSKYYIEPGSECRVKRLMGSERMQQCFPGTANIRGVRAALSIPLRWLSSEPNR